MRTQRRRRGRSFHAPLVVVAGVSLLTASSCSREATCDAAARISDVEVSLSQDWPEREEFTVRVDCDEAESCLGIQEPRGPMLTLDVGAPRSLDAIDVSVIDDRTDDEVLAETYDLSWTHHPAVGECGQEWSEDRVVVPVPRSLT